VLLGGPLGAHKKGELFETRCFIIHIEIIRPMSLVTIV